jgi:uncharacterized protein YkwD
MMKKTAAVFAVMMILGAIFGAAPALAGAAEDIVRFTNEERTAMGLPKLRIDKNLMNAAAERARECAIEYSHTRPDGRECPTVLKEYNVSYRSMAENIYYDNLPRPSGGEAVEGWMNSPGHRKNILTSGFTHIGAAVYSEDGMNYAVQLFIGR